MEFLQENYIWLIVVGVFLLMIIIGYFADKSQKFNKEKPKKEKKSKKEKNQELKEKVEETVEEEILEPEGIGSNINPLDDFEMTEGMDNSFNEWDENKKVEPEEEIVTNEIPTMDNSFEEWNVAPEESASEETEEELVEDEKEVPVEEPEVTEEPVEEPTEIDEPTIEEASIEEPEVAEQDSNIEPVEGLETPTEFAEELTDEKPEETTEPVPEEINTGIEDLEITLPSIETLNEEIKDVIDEEDVWKF